MLALTSLLKNKLGPGLRSATPVAARLWQQGCRAAAAAAAAAVAVAATAPAAAAAKTQQQRNYHFGSERGLATMQMANGGHYRTRAVLALLISKRNTWCDPVRTRTVPEGRQISASSPCGAPPLRLQIVGALGFIKI